MHIALVIYMDPFCNVQTQRIHGEKLEWITVVKEEWRLTHCRSIEHNESVHSHSHADLENEAERESAFPEF